MLLNDNVLTLAEWAKRLDPDGKVAKIVEMLNQTNPILTDMRFIEGNLPTGHITTIRTGLPAVYWRMINQGTPTSTSKTIQVTEQAGMLEAWSEVDIKLAALNNNSADFRLSEARAFIEAINIEAASTMFYGNSSLAPEEFTGLSPRFSTLDTGTPSHKNVIDGGGVGSDNTSMWLVVWGENTVHGIFPKGSKAGLQHKDLGEQTVTVTTGMGGNRLRALQEVFNWDLGLVVKDWRYVVRIANIDVSDLAGGTPPDLTTLAIRAEHRIPAFGMGQAAWYTNRTISTYLDIQGREDVSGGGGLTYDTLDGQRRRIFRGVPIGVTDALLDTEDLVA